LGGWGEGGVKSPAVLGDESPEGFVCEAAAALEDAGLLSGGRLQVLACDVHLLVCNVP